MVGNHVNHLSTHGRPAVGSGEVLERGGLPITTGGRDARLIECTAACAHSCCIAALTLGLAACGGGDDGGATQGASDAACGSGTVTIKMVDIKFDPEAATAGVGQEVCWVNEDSIDHNVVANSGATFKSDLFGKGKTFSATVDSRHGRLRVHDPPGDDGHDRSQSTVNPPLTARLTPVTNAAASDAR